MAEYIGRQFGNYRLVRLLARGGFAEVYLGEHLHLGTRAAVKILHTELTGKEIEKFRAEARTIGRLEHPHIVQVLDFGIEDTTPFLAMRYAPNGTLRQRHCSGSQLSPDIIVSYLEQIASALQYAHEQKLIHRDIKPQNMLIGLNEDILLSDFGLAVMSQSMSLQSTQNKAGTLSYMAPEQFQGKVCYASDQYALGVVVYEWLCGELPFSEGVLEYQHRFQPPPSLREKDPHISPALEQVVLKTLAKDPKDRFASIQDFAAAFVQASKEVAQFSSPANVSLTSSPTRFELSSEAPSSASGIQVPFLLPLPSHDQIPLPKLSPAHARLIAQPHLPVASSPVSSEFLTSVKQSQRTVAPSTPAHTPSPVPPLALQAASPVARRSFSRSTSLLSIGLVLIIVLTSAAYIVHLQTTTRNPDLPITVTQTHITAPATPVTNDPLADSTGAMFGFDPAHTHYNSYEDMLSPANVSHLVQYWVDKLDCNSSIKFCTIDSSPVVSHGIVYIGSMDRNLYAFNAANGKLLWSASTGNAIISSPAVANGIVYIGSQDDFIYAFSAMSGKLLWLGKTGDSISSSPTVAKGVLYIGSNDHRLYAFEANGCGQTFCRPKWSASTGGYFFSSPAVTNGVVYIGSSDGKLYAFKADGCGRASCSPLWFASTGGPIMSSPTVANGVVYIGSMDHNLYAFRADGCGKEACPPLWSASSGALIAASSPAVANGVVYIGSTDGKLYAFHLQDTP